MNKRSFLWILAMLLTPVAGHAQDKEDSTPVQIRAVLHDPAHPESELYLPDQTGKPIKLELVPSCITAAQLTIPVDGSVLLYNSATIDPKKPLANVAASVKVPKNTKRAIVIIVPSPPNSSPAYRMVLVDDSPAAFPKGEGKVLSLVPVEVAIEAGEHKLAVAPGKITDVPAVKKVDDFHNAQTNFYYKLKTAWVPFIERRTQYLDAFRRIYIVHVTPGASQPSITTIVDTLVAARR
jgi:hypothetical protein